MPPVRLLLVVSVLVFAVPVISADPVACIMKDQPQGLPQTLPPPCLPPDAPPEGVVGEYDELTNVFTVSWSAPSNVLAPDGYVVYRDGEVFATASATSTTDDLTGFTGTHSYRVAATWLPDHEGDQSLPAAIVLLSGADGYCWGISAGDVPPVFVNPENCL